MDSKTVSLIKSKLKRFLNDKEIFDIILFCSFVKGKALPRDIDVAFITRKTSVEQITDFHVSLLKPEDFFHNPPSLVHTLLREGYSLKYGKSLAERYDFSGRALFTYTLESLTPSQKVKIVTTLRGMKNKGMVIQYSGAWLANQVFTVPIEFEYLFRQFFLNFHIHFKQFFILMH